MAMSAFFSSSSTSAPSRGNTVIPMLVLTKISRPSMCIGAATASRTLCATVTRRALLGTPSTIKVNSSPPRREMVSTSRSCSFRRVATICRTLSPVLWPSVSLICLKRSRSKNIKPIMAPLRLARAMA